MIRITKDLRDFMGAHRDSLIMELKGEGLGRTAIAKQVGCGNSAVDRVVKASGLNDSVSQTGQNQDSPSPTPSIFETDLSSSYGLAPPVPSEEPTEYEEALLDVQEDGRCTK